MAALSEKLKELAGSIISFVLNIIKKINGLMPGDMEEDVSDN